MSALERGLQSSPQKYGPRRDTRRVGRGPSCRRSGRPRAARGSTLRGGGPRRSAARIESAISAGVRAPMSRPAGVSIRSSSSSGDARRRAARRAPPRRACGWPRARRRAARPRAPRRRIASSSRPCAATTSARSSGRRRDPPPSSTGTASSPSSGAEPQQRRRDRRVAGDDHPRRGQERLEEHLDRAARQARVLDGDRRRRRAPPRRSTWRLSSTSGRRAGSAAAAARRARSPAASRARTLCCGAHAADEPLDASRRSWTSATLPGRALVGCCDAHDRGGDERARPARLSSCARSRARPVIIAAARASLHRRPHARRACTACRCGRRRGSRAARR